MLADAMDTYVSSDFLGNTTALNMMHAYLHTCLIHSYMLTADMKMHIMQGLYVDRHVQLVARKQVVCRAQATCLPRAILNSRMCQEPVEGREKASSGSSAGYLCAKSHSKLKSKLPMCREPVEGREKASRVSSAGYLYAESHLRVKSSYLCAEILLGSR